MAWNYRVFSQLFMFHKRATYIQVDAKKVQKVIHSYVGHLCQQVRHFRLVMEEPSFILAADSDVDELDLQEAMRKIRRTMKRRFQQKCEDLIEAKRPCVDVDAEVVVKSDVTNPVLRCENGNDSRSNSCDSSDGGSPALDAMSTSSNVMETSNTSSSGSGNKTEPLNVAGTSNISSGGSGNKKEKKKRKLSSRLERILKHRFDKMQNKTDAESNVKRLPETKSLTPNIPGPSHDETSTVSTTGTSNELLVPTPDQYLALDCEFVGVGLKGSISKLGRCSIVDYHGNVVYDMYSRPEEFITDYRTRYSGISYRHMIKAIPFVQVQEKVEGLIKGKILVGHDIKQDLRVLKIDHPIKMIRDTCTHPSVKKKAKDLGCYRQALRNLSWCLLGRRIQTTTHCSVEDATATMDLFKLVRQEWEESLIRQTTNKERKKSATRTQDAKQERCEKDSELSEFLDDKFWPEDHQLKDQLSDISDDSVQTKVLPNGVKPAELYPASALNEVAQRLKWELPEYEYECLSEYPPEFVCKVLVNDEKYQSTSCSSKKEAKAAAAEAFFVHHRKSGSESYMDVLEHMTVNSESKNQTAQKLNPASALNEVAQRLKWELPEYQYECLSEYPPEFVCKVLVNDEEYQSTSCSSKKEAKAAAAEAFFVRHRKSGSESYMDVLEHMTVNLESKNQTAQKLYPVSALNEVAQRLKWELPEYQYECLSEYPPEFVCKNLVSSNLIGEYKGHLHMTFYWSLSDPTHDSNSEDLYFNQIEVLVNDEEYQSTSCSSKKEAKAAAAEAFFVRHRKSGSESYMDVLKHIASSKESENHTDPSS